MVKNNKKGLGRGLDSLLGESFEEDFETAVPNKIVQPKEDNIETVDGNVLIRKTTYTKQDSNNINEQKIKTQNVLEVFVEDIQPNPNQPRTNFNQEELEQLSSSIKRNGLLQPILVTKIENGKYEIIAGERRWKASKLAGLKTVPIIIKQADKDKKLELALIENIQRKDLNPIEEAYCYKKIMETQGLGQNEVANLVSKGRSTITNALRLLNLPEEAQKLLYEDKITAGHARAILSVNTDTGKKQLTEKIINDNLSVREAEALANLYSGQTSKALTTKRPAAPKSYKKVAKTLRGYFGNQVRVKQTKGKNKIEIEFKDEKDLQRIYELIISQ